MLEAFITLLPGSEAPGLLNDDTQVGESGLQKSGVDGHGRKYTMEGL
jgi:hypothetical protein